jgi:hypothetical protein
VRAAYLAGVYDGFIPVVARARTAILGWARPTATAESRRLDGRYYSARRRRRSSSTTFECRSRR